MPGEEGGSIRDELGFVSLNSSSSDYPGMKICSISIAKNPYNDQLLAPASIIGAIIVYIEQITPAGPLSINFIMEGRKERDGWPGHEKEDLLYA